MRIKILLIFLAGLSIANGQFFSLNGGGGGFLSNLGNTANRALGGLVGGSTVRRIGEAVGGTASRTLNNVVNGAVDGIGRLLNAVDLSYYDPNRSLDSYWDGYLKLFNKNFGSGPLSELRKQIFSSNLNLIQQHNNLLTGRNSLFSMQVYDFADLNYDDFLRFKTGAYIDEQDTDNYIHEFVISYGFHEPYYTETNVFRENAEMVDWTRAGHVTSVKDQGNCGGCWAFATTGALESQYSIKYNQKLNLSEQHLLDCDGKNNGCRGGNPYKAFISITKNSITSAPFYPFIGQEQGTCSFNPNAMPSVACKGIDTKNYKLFGNEQALKEIVRLHGPVAATLRITQSFRFYKSGIFFDEQCEGPKNHAVLITGYGTENGVDFWILKNSWGEAWGEFGYMRFARNNNNMCGIAYYGAVPYV